MAEAQGAQAAPGLLLITPVEQVALGGRQEVPVIRVRRVILEAPAILAVQGLRVILVHLLPDFAKLSPAGQAVRQETVAPEVTVVPVEMVAQVVMLARVALPEAPVKAPQLVVVGGRA